MSENNKIIFFIFKEEKNEVKLPNNFINLKIYFQSVFNLQNTDIDKYSFFYKDQNQNEIEINNQKSFENFLLQYNQNKTNEIYIKEGDDSIMKSEVMGFNGNESSELSVLNVNENNNNTVVENKVDNNANLQDVLNKQAEDPEVSNLTFCESQIQNNEYYDPFKNALNGLNNIYIIKGQKNKKDNNSNENNDIINNNNINNNSQDKQEKEINTKEKDIDNNKENFQSIIKNLEDKIKLIEKENNDLKNEKSQYKSKIDILEIEKSELQKNFNQSKNENIFNSNYLKDSQNENAKLKNEIKYLKSEEENNKKKIAKLEKENSELKEVKKLVESSICNTVHTNIKCEHCFSNPIKGIRYKCSICNNYNLCQQCHEKNSETGKHQHFFYSLKNKDNNSIAQAIIDKKNYSYKCLSTDLKKYIYRGKKEAYKQIIIQNNCKDKWPENAKLILDKNISQIFTEDIKLNSLAPNEQMTLNISFKNLQNLPSNEYKIYFDFNVNGINFGNKLCIIIIIKKDTEKEIINKFRNQYNTPNTYIDDTILYILEETDGEFEEAFFRLYLT